MNSTINQIAEYSVKYNNGKIIDYGLNRLDIYVEETADLTAENVLEQVALLGYDITDITAVYVGGVWISVA